MSLRHFIFVYMTLFIALVLDVLPLPGWGVWLRPDWTLLMLIYWAMVIPYGISVGNAFFMGVILDLLYGSLLGEHALALVVVIYIVAKIHKQLWMSPFSQQVVIVGVLALFYKIILFSLQAVIGQAPHSALYWAAVIVDLILWPWVFMWLNSWQKRFHIGIA